MVQILAGLITYLLLTIRCHENHGELVNIKRVRELRVQIQNEFRALGETKNLYIFKEQDKINEIHHRLTVRSSI